jgi:Flp pilus assembly protein TadD
MKSRTTLAIVLYFCWFGIASGHFIFEEFTPSDAIGIYKHMLYLNERDFEARNALAMAYCRTGKLLEAEKELEWILKRDEQNFDAINGMGVLLLKKGKYKNALSYLEKAVKLNNSDPMVYVHLSAAFHMLNKKDKAMAHWKKALFLAYSHSEREKLKDEMRWVIGQ